MTTEDAFQAALDANPNDATIRLVFADWLDEQDDSRGPGYQALGTLRRVPHRTVIMDDWSFGCGDMEKWSDYYWTRRGAMRLPMDWSQKLSNQHVQKTRRKLEDLAALAFGRLPVKRQQELLGQLVEA